MRKQIALHLTYRDRRLGPTLQKLDMYVADIQNS
jgi:hypothetical protein